MQQHTWVRLFSKPNIRLTILILGIGCVTALLSVRYFAHDAGQLTGGTVWELKYVLLPGQLKSPADVYANSRSPKILFASDIDYKGNDGCNSYHGQSVYMHNGYIRFSPAERTRMACNIILPGEDGTVVRPPPKPEFLDVLESAVRYEIKQGELHLYYPADESTTMVFQPTTEPLRYLGTPIRRWECTVFRFLSNILTNWCWIE